MKTAHYIIFFIFKLLDKREKRRKRKVFWEIWKRKIRFGHVQNEKWTRKILKNLPFAPKCSENFDEQKIFVTENFGQVALDNDNKMITKCTFWVFLLEIVL